MSIWAGKRIRFCMGVLCVLVVALGMMPMLAHAAPENACWTKAEDGWVLRDEDGTELTAKMRGNKLYIQGTGAVPSYTKESLGNRPWHGQTIYEIEIGAGVTSIGAEAFSNFRYLTKVTMPVTVFIEDASAFGGAHEGAVFSFNGTSPVSRDIGKIPYTSYDSIVAFMERYDHYYHYRVADYHMVLLAKGKTGHTLTNISPTDALSTAFDPANPYIDLRTSVRIVGGATSDMGVQVVSRQQGLAALEVFSLMIGEDTYIGAYNMTLVRSGDTVKKAQSPMTFVMQIPEYHRMPGRSFSLIQLGPGVVDILEDEDTWDDTITFTTDYPSTTYALVYHDQT